MKPWKRLLIATMAICCGVLMGSWLTTFATTVPVGEQPGSVTDPIVTKSYVDEKITEALQGKVPVQTPADVQSTSTVVKLVAGQEIIGDSGTQLIVRSGKAFVRSDEPVNGIADVTDGIDLKQGQPIPNNHLIIIPRKGRGIYVESTYTQPVFVTVNGPYEWIKQPQS